MLSKTSSCNRTALRKDLGRFAPAWVAYGLFLLIVCLMVLEDEIDYWFVSNVADFIQVMGIVNCAYALLTASLLFGDLFNSRMCNALHAMPLKREQWFAAHVKAGLLFSLIPTALTALGLAVVIHTQSTFRSGWQVPLYWFAGANLQYLFFFGLAVLCAMCAGNRFAMAVLYGMVNFGSILIYLLVDSLYTPLLYGVMTPTEVFYRLCPVVQITGRASFLDTFREETGHTYLDARGVVQKEYLGRFEVVPENWMYVLILAALGAALLLIALALYRRRKLECAGDFLAGRHLEPVFQVAFTVLCAAAFHAVFYVFFGSSSMGHVLMAIGLAVGWIAGRMFLERTVRVFRPKNILGLGAMAAAVVLSLYVTKLDPLGIETWIPKAEQVRSVNVFMDYYAQYEAEDPQAIADAIRIHQVGLTDRPQLHPDYDYTYYNPNNEEDEAVRVRLEYTLADGSRAKREYKIWVSSEAGQLLRRNLSPVETVVRTKDLTIHSADDLLRQVRTPYGIYINGEAVPEEFLTEEFVEQLCRAILRDCEAQTLVQHSQFHPYIMATSEKIGHLQSLELNVAFEDTAFWLDVYADSANTMALMEQTGIPDQILQEIAKEYGG